MVWHCICCICCIMQNAWPMLASNDFEEIDDGLVVSFSNEFDRRIRILLIISPKCVGLKPSEHGRSSPKTFAYKVGAIVSSCSTSAGYVGRQNECSCCLLAMFSTALKSFTAQNNSIEVSFCDSS